MNNQWVLIDTETTGISQPIYVVEIAAQRMEGWVPCGEPFKRIINHGCSIPPEASRVNGYTAEILERDGLPPNEVYDDFAEYVSGLPIVAYNLSYDWDKVLIPEWSRLGRSPIGSRGFCAYLLAQRLLDPVPAGNCKLQTLRQYYRLPERGAHTALGDVETVVDLMEHVLQPIAAEISLDNWQSVIDFTEEEWFPSRIPFGKFKGRAYNEARNNLAIRSWLEWLSTSSNPRSSGMGSWYLAQLDTPVDFSDATFTQMDADPTGAEVSSHDIVRYRDLEAEHYQRLIEASRSRLANIELEFGVEKSRVDSINSQLYSALRDVYEKRDYFKILIQYRHSYVDRLLDEGEEAADDVTEEFKQQAAANEKEYESTAKALDGKVELDSEQQAKLKKLWKALVRMFHPDQYDNDPEKRKTYEMLTQAINQARDRGDIELLETIASNPEEFIRAQGWKAVNLDDSIDVDELRSLYDLLQKNIIETIEALNMLKASPDYELYQLAANDDLIIGRVIATQKSQLEEELVSLEAEASTLKEQVIELLGHSPA